MSASSSRIQDPPSVGHLAVAGAPVSYGAFEITVGTDAWVLGALDLLGYVAGAGYAGIELGPVGYLGSNDELTERLATAGLDMAGGYVQLPFSDPRALELRIGDLDAVMDAFDALGPAAERAKPVLADLGSPERERNPGVAAVDRSIGLTDKAWQGFQDGLSATVARCRERGYEPTFHPHAGTFVEADWEIARVLESSDVGLCYDTGHLIIGGADPLQALEKWGDRVNHVHLKDTSHDVVARYRSDGVNAETYYEGEPFTRLGKGDVDIPAILARLEAVEFNQWLVVEQDVVLRSPEAIQRVADSQAYNRAYLRERGL